MKAPRLSIREWVLAGILISVLLAGGWLVKINYWPSGSDEMLVVSDTTLVRAVVVCADSGEILWRISASGAVQNPKSVPYGKVPPGFVQNVPAHGPPRPFRVNERLQVHVLTDTHNMADLGKALGPREFYTQVWASGGRGEEECFQPK